MSLAIEEALYIVHDRLGYLVINAPRAMEVGEVLHLREDHPLPLRIIARATETEMRQCWAELVAVAEDHGNCFEPEEDTLTGHYYRVEAAD